MGPSCQLLCGFHWVITAGVGAKHKKKSEFKNCVIDQRGKEEEVCKEDPIDQSSRLRTVNVGRCLGLHRSDTIRYNQKVGEKLYSFQFIPWMDCSVYTEYDHLD